MKTNETLQKDVQDAIKWEPLINAAEIGVTVKDEGIVILTGTVDSFYKKVEAEKAAKSVDGVKAVVEKIEVKLLDSLIKSNAEIADEVLNALKGRWDVPSEKIKVKVENGWITLTGEVSQNYQRVAAEMAINYLTGVKGVSNNIIVKSTNAIIEKKAIEDAFSRNWSLSDETSIEVQVLNHDVTLVGMVTSWYQKAEAERIAWNAPGVWKVTNNLIVE